MITTPENQTAEQHGADDAESLVTDAQINERDADPAEFARSILRESSGADDALISALGWHGVCQLAGLAYDEDADLPPPEALAWCGRYNAGFRARLEEIADTDTDTEAGS